MAATDDLAPLLVAGGGSDVGFRQGTVIAWDETTGTNTVDVSGTLLSDLPALNIGDFVHLQSGDVVGLLRFKTTYFILGRVILPQAPDTNRASVAFANASSPVDTGFAINTTVTSRGSLTIDVPSWADEAIVVAWGQCQGVNGSATQDYLLLRARIDGVDGMGLFFRGAAGDFASGSVAATRIITLTGQTTIAVSTRVSTNGQNWGTNATNSCGSNAYAVFRRVN